MTAAARLRQAVLAAHDLDAAAGALRTALGLGEPYADPGVGYFGLRNAVFALGDTFLEVVSPSRPGTAAGRLLERRGSDCGYMVMFQIRNLAAARERVRGEGVREVFAVSLPDIAEVHLHPADMRGAIVSLSEPQSPSAWRWGGPEWEARSGPLRLAGATIGVREPEQVAARWRTILGTPLEALGIRISGGDVERGLSEIALAVEDPGRRDLVQNGPLVIGGVRFRFETDEED